VRALIGSARPAASRRGEPTRSSRCDADLNAGWALGSRVRQVWTDEDALINSLTITTAGAKQHEPGPEG